MLNIDVTNNPLNEPYVNYFLKSFLYDDGTRVISGTQHTAKIGRIHISHNDLDGYGCMLVTKLHIMDDTTNINYSNVGLSEVNETINTTVREIVNAETEKFDKVYLLITDIANVDIHMLEQLSVEYNIKYLVIDHHQWNSKYDTNKCVYISNEYSATLLYFNLVSNLQNKYFVNPPRYPKPSECILNARHVFELISKYDTGKWGKWRNTTTVCDDSIVFNNYPCDGVINTIPAEITLQLLFKWYEYNPNIWVNHMYLLLTHSTEDLVPNANTDGLDMWLSSYISYGIVEYNIFVVYMYERLNEAYNLFLRDIEDDQNLEELMNKYNIKIPDEYKNCVFKIFVDTASDKDKCNGNINGYFSLISKEYLETYTDVDILIMVYDKPDNSDKTVSLRTAKDDINVADIAQFNGGGGHPKAAGFHY